MRGEGEGRGGKPGETTDFAWERGTKGRAPVAGSPAATPTARLPGCFGVAEVVTGWRRRGAVVAPCSLATATPSAPSAAALDLARGGGDRRQASTPKEGEGGNAVRDKKSSRISAPKGKGGGVHFQPGAGPKVHCQKQIARTRPEVGQLAQLAPYTAADGGQDRRTDAPVRHTAAKRGRAHSSRGRRRPGALNSTLEHKGHTAPEPQAARPLAAPAFL